MTIGRNSRKGSVRSSIRAPKFLDKSNGFYGRLDEPETPRNMEEMGKRWNGMEEGGEQEAVISLHLSGTNEGDDAELFDSNEGIMEDDGETLLRRKPSRRSSRWRRRSTGKQKEMQVDECGARDQKPIQDPVLQDTKVMIEIELEKLKAMEDEKEKEGRGKEPALVHFPLRDEADDQVLIRDMKRGREEEDGEERRMKREQEEGMKMVKKNTVKNYRKALDKALRRGWETFITNIYSVTLTPVTSPSSSPTFKKKTQHSLVLAEFH